MSSKMIPYGKQDIDQQDIDAVTEVLKSDWLTQGPQVPLFEQAIADKCQVKYAIAVNSATSALHIANLALGVSKGDIVWTSPISFVATANSALYCGALVDFVDIDLSSGNMSASALKAKLQWAKLNNCLPKVVIPVHLAGQSCDMKAIHELAKSYNFSLIEDASHAVGGQYQGAPIGNCQYSDITIFSFHPVKIITSAEGGMALTNTPKLAKKMRMLRSHGITNDPNEMTEPSHGPWYYQQISLGFNYRMTELQAALGLSQLSRIDSFISKRNQLAKNYNVAFAETSLTCLTPQSSTHSAYHLYIVLLSAINKKAHAQVITNLRAKSIYAHVHYIPIHLQPFYKNLGFKSGDFPVAEEYYSRAISLPLYPQLNANVQQKIIDAILSEIKNLSDTL